MKDPSEKICQFLVFTDLDGTLLDHSTYSFQPALPALKAIQEKNIPLIFCTSKTRAETEIIREQTGNTHPFIVENGGAIYIPERIFSQESDYKDALTKASKKVTEYRIVELGTPYARLREVFSQIQAQYPGRLKGFGDMSVTEVAKQCNFSQDQALLAKNREYDEPFTLEDESLLDKILEWVKHTDLRITQGGRFYHLIGANDKGQAVSHLIKIYRQQSGKVRSIALGDSSNDLPMLAAVDIPVLLPKPDGRYDPSVLFDGLFIAKDAGPSGWNDAVLKIIQDS